VTLLLLAYPTVLNTRKY